MKRHIIQFLTLLATVPVCGVALAHDGVHVSYGLLQGMIHPFTGLDHMIALIAVGLWASTLDTRNCRIALLSFSGALLTGAMLAIAGVTLPGIEAGIATSVLVAGLLLAFNRVSTRTGITLVTLFAVFHGQAHINNAAADFTYMGYAAGFLLITVTLLMASLSLGYVLQALRVGWLMRAAGVLYAGIGAWFLLA